MKHVGKCLVLPAALLAVHAHAFDFQRHDGRFVLPADANLTNETILTAESMELNGAAHDDLFLLATGAGFFSRDADSGRIALNGEYDNDVWAWGAHVMLRGHVRDHARLGGVSVVIHGRISGNALLAANNVHIARTAELGGAARILAENAICEGSIDGDLRVIGGNVTLAGRFAGNVRVNARDLVMLPGTVVEGDLEYWAPREIIAPDGVMIRGQMRRMTTPGDTPSSNSVLPGLIWSLLSTLCVGTLLVAACPGFFGDAARQARHAPGRAMKAGLIFMLGAPPVMLIMMLSVIGLPSALLLGMLAAMLVYLGKPTLAMALGLLLFPDTAPRLTRRALMQKFTVGLVVMHLAIFPISAWPVWILSATLGAGALLRAGQLKKIN